MKFRPVFAFACALMVPAWLQASQVAVLQFERDGALLPPVAVEVYEQDAPHHAANFQKLVRKGFYQGTAVHRVVTGSLVQLGDPLSRDPHSVDLGTGGPGYTLAPEVRRRNVRGSVGMGRLPDKLNPARVSNGSQFYIALKPLPELDGQYTVFGGVVQGIEVFDQIASVTTDTNDMPLQRVSVYRCRTVDSAQLPAQMAKWRPTPEGRKLSWWRRWLHGLNPL